MKCPHCESEYDLDCCLKAVGHLFVNGRGVNGEILIKCNHCYKKAKIMFQGGFFLR